MNLSGTVAQEGRTQMQNFKIKRFIPNLEMHLEITKLYKKLGRKLGNNERNNTE